MHNLVHELNKMGERAFLWRSDPIYKMGVRGKLRSWLNLKPMVTNPLLNTPVASPKDRNRESIVVYPEIVRGNPLNAQHVVRWLLYPPGMRHPYKFGRNEMFFRAGAMSDLPEVTGGATDLFLWTINPAYRNENRPDRRGVCYLVRKGNAKPRLPQTETSEAIQVDGMSHEQMNEVFNRCDTFYSYDEATMYSQFAAIAGCTSIVVPGLYASRAEWVAAHPNGRYGVAYGDTPSELDHARATRQLLLDDMRAKERDSIETVRRFIDLTHRRFWNDSGKDGQLGRKAALSR